MTLNAATPARIANPVMRRCLVLITGRLVLERRGCNRAAILTTPNPPMYAEPAAHFSAAPPLGREFITDDPASPDSQSPTRSDRDEAHTVPFHHKRLGDFELVREIGRGGMGVVYEAQQVSLRRKVALKVLPPGLGLTSQAISRFEREARAAAQPHHTNIVPVHAIGEASGCHFYAMDLVDGQPL